MLVLTRRISESVLRAINSTKIIHAIEITIAILMLSSCAINQDQIEQDSRLKLQVPPHHCFKQLSGNRLRPDEFVTCDDVKEQCCCKKGYKSIVKQKVSLTTHSGGNHHA